MVWPGFYAPPQANGEITLLKATVAKVDPSDKPKGWIHWVSSSSPDVSPIRAEVRWYNRLFPDPVPKKDASGKWIVNESSLTTYDNALVDKSIAGAVAGDSFQFEREGYFCVDQDSTKEKTVLNLTVELKGEDLKSLEKKSKVTE